MQSGVGNVVFDFEDTKFMDSSGIGIIIGIVLGKRIPERAVKWFRFGTHAGISLAKEIIGQIPEKKPPKKKKELTIS